MDKKAYIAPEMEVMNVETVTMIATSFQIEGEQEVLDAESRGRRGTWGNLWER